MATVALTPAALDDLDVLCELVIEFHRVDGHPHDDVTVRRALTELLATAVPPPGVALLILRDGVVDGYAVVTWGFSLESGGREALVDELYVRHRRDGTGSRAMAALLEASRAAGARRVFLETERTNADVRRFYARHGFVADDSIWMSRDL